MTSSTAARMDCLLVADDLTGACDAAVHFASSGRRVIVPLAEEAAAPEADVVAYSTASRDLGTSEAVCRLRRLAGLTCELAPRVLYKKIDSTLRGNTAVEIMAALEAFGCDAAVVNPAFPAVGRIVRDGWLELPCDPSFRRIEIAAWLRDRTAASCVPARADEIAGALENGARFVVTDAECDSDLDAIAEAAVAMDRRILWVGSGGLAAALARRLPGHRTAQTASEPKQCGRVLFCIGSDHPVTVGQQRRLADYVGAHVIPIRLGEPMPELPDWRPAALFACGGDTAALVMAALGTRAIELRREFSPGIPEGMLRGGVFDGVPVLTKSGGFGEPEDLIRIAEYFYG